MKNLKNWLRHLIQWGALLAIIIFLTKVFGTQNADPEAYCPFGGLQTLGTYLVAGSMACSMTMTQIMMGVVLAIAVILFSKLFCGYLCPLGWGSEYLDKLRAKMKIKSLVIKNGSITDRLLRLFKFVLLFIIFYYTINDSELFCKNLTPTMQQLQVLKVNLRCGWQSQPLPFLFSAISSSKCSGVNISVRWAPQ